MQPVFSSSQQDSLLMMRASYETGALTEFPESRELDQHGMTKAANRIRLAHEQGLTSDQIVRLDVYRHAVLAGFYTDAIQP